MFLVLIMTHNIPIYITPYVNYAYICYVYNCFFISVSKLVLFNNISKGLRIF